jgi:hypothetical protein
MAKFMAIHTMPGDEVQFKNMMANAASIMILPQGFNYKQTYCDFIYHKFFCDWEAPSKEGLEEVFKQLKMPFDSIHSVKIFNPTNGQLE